MKRYNLVNVSEDAVIKSDRFGDYVRYEDIENLILACKEVAEWNWYNIIRDSECIADCDEALNDMTKLETAYYELIRR